MSKTRKPARRQAPDRAATVDIVSQLECAAKNPQATLIGALIGGVVPWFARTLAHDQLPSAWSHGNKALAMVMLVVVLGCALFSALTVYKFGRAAFGCQKKALGFTLALEGVMLVSTGTTSAAALAVLIGINALANGSVIALAREATCKRRAAVAKSAETRARRSAQPVAKAPAAPSHKAL
jgi:DMSO reductase anchor subunit